MFLKLLTQIGLGISLFIHLLVLAFAGAQAQTSSFTYQGRLSDGGTPANGTMKSSSRCGMQMQAAHSSRNLHP